MSTAPQNAWDSPSFVPLDDPYGGKGPLMMSVTWSLATIAMILIALRTYTNAYIVKRFAWDYHFAILTLVSLVASYAFMTRNRSR